MDRGEFLRSLIALLNASPYYRHIGMRVVECLEGTSRLELQAKECVQNLYGTLHGGVLASLVDSACGVALGTLLEEGEFAVTVDLRINYLCAASAGLLLAEGRVLQRGRNIGVAEADVRAAGGTLIAKGMTTHFIQKAS
jgi:uncharacterized protein (TIGR00369 family)